MSLLYPSTILSEIVKPLSATNVSPGNNLYNIPQFSERNLLEVRPPQASETKDTEEIHSSIRPLSEDCDLIQLCVDK